MPTSTSRLPLLFTLCLALAGCDDDDGAATTRDGDFLDSAPGAPDADIPGDGPLPDAFEGCAVT